MRERRRRNLKAAPETNRDANAKSIPLTHLVPGDAGRVVDVLGEGAFRRRLLDMGFVSGTFVRVIKHAPLMNPIEYCIGGTHISLRRDEAARVVVDQVPPPERCGKHMGRAGRHGLRHGRGKGHRWWRRGR